jgi:hypothetical protein
MLKLTAYIRIAGPIILLVAFAPASVPSAKWRARCVVGRNCQNTDRGKIIQQDFASENECRKHINDPQTTGVTSSCECREVNGTTPQGPLPSGSGDPAVKLTTDVARALITGMFSNQSAGRDETAARRARLAQQEVARQEDERRRLKKKAFNDDKEQLLKELQANDSGIGLKGLDDDGSLKLMGIDDVADQCLICERNLINQVSRGAGASGNLKGWINGARILYSNCMAKDGDSCEGTCGKVLYKALAVCNTYEDVQMAVKATKQCREEEGGTYPSASNEPEPVAEKPKKAARSKGAKWPAVPDTAESILKMADRVQAERNLLAPVEEEYRKLLEKEDNGIAVDGTQKAAKEAEYVKARKRFDPIEREAQIRTLEYNLRNDGASEKEIANARNTENAFINNCGSPLEGYNEDKYTRNGLYSNSFKITEDNYRALANASRTSGTGARVTTAGTQEEYNDCVLHVLANSTQHPYGFTSALALEKTRDSHYRPKGIRNDPAIAVDADHGGLDSIEIVESARSLGGTTKAIKRSDIGAEIARNRRPIIVGINQGVGGHVVVVTNVFQKDGRTYYEVMDSNAGSKCTTCRNGTTYWEKSDFESVMTTSGLEILPAKGTAPKLLKDPKGAK